MNRWHRRMCLIVFGLACDQASFDGLRLANAKRFFGRFTEVLLLCVVGFFSKARICGLFVLGAEHLSFQGICLLPQVIFLRNLSAK